MKCVGLFFLGLVFSFHINAQDITALLKEANRLEAVPDEKGALNKFKEVLNLQPVNIQALNKCSELCSRIGRREQNNKLRDEYLAAAKTYATIALKINPNDGESNCLMAMALGRSALTKSGKEKINNAKDIKKYIDISLKNDPVNYKAWHVLGRWHYEISLLNMFEKGVVNVFYGGMPNASLKESIRCFEKARSLAPGFILNYYEMSKAYKENAESDKAIASLNTMLSLPNQTEDDPFTKQKGKVLLNEWK